MHYYYDGFMWKVGKKEIRQNLIDEDSAEGPSEEALPRRGWNALVTRWQNARAQWTALSYGFETGKQVLYFGVPILFLAWTDAQYSLSDVNAKEYLSRLAPSVAKAHDDLGVAYSQQGDFDRGIVAHQQAIAADSTYAQAYTHLGIAHSLKGHMKVAIGLHQQAIALDPELAQAHFNLGVEYAKMERLGEAIGAFERAVALDSDYGRAHLALAQTYKKMGNQPLAKRHWNRARDLQAAAQRKDLSLSAMPWATGTPLKGDTLRRTKKRLTKTSALHYLFRRFRIMRP